MERPDFQLYLNDQKVVPTTKKDEEDVSRSEESVIEGTHLHIEEITPPLTFVHNNSL